MTDDGDIPREALRFLIKVDRLTLGAVQFAQFVHDLAGDLHLMARSDPGTGDAARELQEALGEVDRAMEAIEAELGTDFDSYAALERSREAALATARTLERVREALEAMGEIEAP